MARAPQAFCRARLGLMDRIDIINRHAGQGLRVMGGYIAASARWLTRSVYCAGLYFTTRFACDCGGRLRLRAALKNRSGARWRTSCRAERS